MKKSVGGTDSVVEVGGSSSGITSTFTAYEYTATANQTTFSGSDNYSNTLAYNTGTPPKVQVFMNGILLDEGSSQDYTGTNGTSVVLTTGADAGDLIQIHAYKSDVSVSSNINFGDNKKLQFGDAQDLQIYHDGSNSYINDTGTGALFLKTNYLAVAGANGNQLINAEQGAAVELYDNNVKKLETDAAGVNIIGGLDVVNVTSTGTINMSHDGATLFFGADVDMRIKHDGSTGTIQCDTGILNVTNDDIRFKTSGAETMLRAVANGAVELMHNNATKLTTTSTGINVAGTVNVNGAYTLPTSDGSSGQALVTDGSGALSFATVSGGAVTSMSDADGDTKIQVEESSDEDKIRFDANGVEIVRMGFNSSSESTLEIVRNGVPANQGQITFNGSGLITDVTSGYHSLIVRNGGSEHLRVRSNGNVGIGESSPGQKLQVNGNIRADGHYYVGGQIVIDSNRRILAADGAANVPYITFAADTNTGLYRPGTDILGFSTAGSERVRIDASGRVGINNTSPSSQYFNNLVVGDNSAGDKGITIRANSANKGVLAFSDTDSADANRYTGYIAYQHTDNSMRFHTNGGGERMRITSAGYVGIGTNAPANLLHVNSGTNDWPIRAHSTDAKAGIIIQDTNTTNYLISQSYTLSIGNQASLHASNLNIKSTGDVGIGTISPTARLDVRRGDASGKIAEFHQNTGYGIDIGSSQAVAYISSGYNQRLDFKTDPTSGQTERMSILANGHVGIGTTSPTAHSGTGFVVHATTGGSGNTGSPRIRLTNTTTGQSATDGAELSLDGNTKDFYIENREGQDIIFYSGSERMRIDSSGNFLVGSTSAANSSAGFRAYAGGNGAFTRASTVLDLNRLSTDGTIIQFQKDTVNVGSIGTAGSDIYIAGLDSNHAALRLAASVKAVLPVTHTGALNDNTTNLGQSNARFKDLHLSGKTHIGHAVIDDYAVNTSATSAAQVDTFAAATFRTARYTIQITNTTDSTYHVTELLLIHDGTTPSITEYGTIYTGSASEATFDADIVSGNVRLLATPASSDTMQFKVVRHSILV